MTSSSANGNISPALKHPLQRLQSPSRTASLVLHVLGLVDFAKCFEYLHRHPNPINQSFGWHFQYLTILGIPFLDSIMMLILQFRPSCRNPHIYSRNLGRFDQLKASFPGQECASFLGRPSNIPLSHLVSRAYRNSSKH